MVEKCLIWPNERCDSLVTIPDGVQVTSSRAGGIYSLSGSLMATKEFTDLTIDEKVRLTDAIVEINDAGKVASFGSGQIRETLERRKTKTEDRQKAFLKLVYDRDPNFKAEVPIAIAIGFMNEQLAGSDHAGVIKFNNDKNTFIARTSSRNIEDIHNLAQSLIDSGKLDPSSSKTKYILSSETFKDIESVDLIQSPNPVVEKSSLNRFDKLVDIVNLSPIDQGLKNIVNDDIKQAKLSYSGGAYKACVIMLGASLEGLMLGTLQRNDVVSFVKSNPAQCPAELTRLGTGNPNFNTLIQNLRFQDMKQALNQLISELGTEGVTNIQNYRNAIHPTKPLSDHSYRDFDEVRATHYITGVDKIMATIANWQP